MTDKTITRAAALALCSAAAVATLTPTGLAAAPTDPVKSALQRALDDEYRAEATYQAILDKHGDVRPFANIIQAERRHAEMVKAEMTRRGMTIPANPYAGKVTAPSTLLEACQTGVTAEQENIALYDKLLPTVADPQVKDVLTRLQWASRANHLPAFDRCVARGGTPGMGPGGGQGAGGGRGGW